MAWSATNYLRTAPTTVNGAAVVGDYIVCVGGGTGSSFPTNAYVVFHVPSRTAKTYSLPSSSGRLVRAYGSNAVIAGSSFIHLVNPADGEVIRTFGPGSFSSFNFLEVWGSTALWSSDATLAAWDIGTGTQVATTNAPSAISMTGNGMTGNGDFLYFSSSGSTSAVYRFRLSGGTLSQIAVSNTVTTRTAGHGVNVGNQVHWPADLGVAVYDAATSQLTFRAYTPANPRISLFSSSTSIDGPQCLGPDGAVYLLPLGSVASSSATTQMFAYNPSTFQWKLDTLPAPYYENLTQQLPYRSVLVSAGGKLWSPFNRPNNW